MPIKITAKTHDRIAQLPTIPNGEVISMTDYDAQDPHTIVIYSGSVGGKVYRQDMNRTVVSADNSLRAIDLEGLLPVLEIPFDNEVELQLTSKVHGLTTLILKHSIETP